MQAGLQASDAALFVVSACDEIDEATRLLWRECAVVGMPRAVAVTKLEQARADFDETVARCQRAFGDAQPADIPRCSGRSLARLVNLLRRTVADYGDGTPVVREPDAEEAALIEERRGPLMESIIEESEDEVLLERHLNGEDIEFETVAADLRAAIATARSFRSWRRMRRPAWASRSCTSCSSTASRRRTPRPCCRRSRPPMARTSVR